MGKTTRAVRYELNQIPYEYIVEVTNRLKVLDVVNTVPGELWTEVHNIIQEAANKTILKKKKSKKAKWLSEETTYSRRTKRHEKQGREGKVYPTKCRFPKKGLERREGLLKRTVFKTRRKRPKGKERDLFSVY